MKLSWADILQLEKWLVYLDDLQMKVTEIETIRDTHNETVSQKVLLLVEETFEVIKTLRFDTGVATDLKGTHKFIDTHLTDQLNMEIVDLLFVSSAIANRLETTLSEIVKILINNKHEQVLFSEKPNNEEKLHGALDIAVSVLSVMTEYMGKTNSNDASPKSEKRCKPGELSEQLAKTVVCILTLAARTGTNLEVVTVQKLQQDEFRHWSTIRDEA